MQVGSWLDAEHDVPGGLLPLDHGALGGSDLEDVAAHLELGRAFEALELGHDVLARLSQGLELRLVEDGATHEIALLCETGALLLVKTQRSRHGVRRSQACCPSSTHGRSAATARRVGSSQNSFA